jgi:hypothetical protein
MRTNKVSMIGAAAALAAVMAIPAVAAADSHEGAKVRVGHFSPDAPAVDIYAGDQILGGLEDVEFGTLSPYLPVPAGTYAISVVVADQEPTAENTVIGPADLTFEEGTMTTVAATGFVADIAPVVLADPAEPQEGIAQVRVVHFSPDAPAVDIALDGGDVVVPGLEFPMATDGYLNLDEGEYDLEIRAAGTDTVAFDIPPLTLDGNNSYSVFAIGSLTDESFTVLPALDASADMDEMAEEEEMAEE